MASTAVTLSSAERPENGENAGRERCSVMCSGMKARAEPSVMPRCSEPSMSAGTTSSSNTRSTRMLPSATRMKAKVRAMAAKNPRTFC